MRSMMRQLSVFLTYLIQFMQPQSELKTNESENFWAALNRIDHFCHIKQFKSLSQTKLDHLYIVEKTGSEEKEVPKAKKKSRPADLYTQMRRLFVQMIYFYYVAYQKKLNLYVYKHYCINQWGVIIKYFSFKKLSFMEEIQHDKFQENVKRLLGLIWQFRTKEEIEYDELTNQDEAKNSQQAEVALFFNNWYQFADIFVQTLAKIDHQTFKIKDFIKRFEITKHVKNNVTLIGVLVSTMFPAIKFNQNLQRVYFEICKKEPYIISEIFTENSTEEGRKNFMQSIFRLFKSMDNSKIRKFTSTRPQGRVLVKPAEKEVEKEQLLIQVCINLENVSIWQQDLRTQQKKQEKDEKQKQKMNQQSNQNESQSNAPSDNECNNQNGPRRNHDPYFGNAVFQYYWSNKVSNKELCFRVTLSIDKKICRLYWGEVQDAWQKLSSKWKVILDENKQLSGFNPGFIMMGYNREANENQVTFTEFLKCQPVQSAISELIITTDKLIIAAIAMRDILCYYERKSQEGQIKRERLELNSGKIEDMAKSVCQSVKNYYLIKSEIINKVQNLKKQQARGY